jgi:Ca2+-binding EF-hand superfamily protein
LSQQDNTLEHCGLSEFYEKNHKEDVMDIFKTVLESNENTLKDEELAFILNTLEYYQDQSYFHELWRMMENYDHTYKQVVEFINQNQDYTNLIKTYLDPKFNLSAVVEILAQMDKLLETSPFLLKNRYFQKLAIQNTAHAVGNSYDLFVAASFVKAFQVTNPEVDFSKIKDKMMVYCEIVLLDKLELQKITLKDIDTYAHITTAKLNEKELKDKRLISKYKVLKVLQELFHTPVVSAVLTLQQLSPANREELQEVLKNILRSNISEDYFHHILAAFEDEDGGYHYPQLFAYLSKNADEKLMLSFIIWTAKNLQLDHHYNRALKAYLKSHPRSIWKNKSARKELSMISTSSFRRLVKEVESESASPVVKFIKKYGIQVSCVLLITLTVGVGLYFGYHLLTDNKDKAVVSKPNKVVASEPVKNQDLDPFKEWISEEPFVFNINGEPLKITFGGANPTGGKSLVLINSQNIETPFDLVMDSEALPFDEKGVLKEGFSLYHTEYDFDSNGNPEVVMMALSQTFESFVWVFSPISENGSVSLRAVLALKGMSAAKLADNTLKLLGDQGQSETYAYLNQQFVKQ